MSLSSATEAATQPLLEAAECFRIDANTKLEAKSRSELGQFMTPAAIARFMASLFTTVDGDVRLLDPGAGVGSLSAAFLDRAFAMPDRISTVHATAFEISPTLRPYLATTLDSASERLSDVGISTTSELVASDFIEDCCETGLFDARSPRLPFTHVITNPPYKKINSKSVHRKLLRNVGLEASNLYAAFLYLAARELECGGEMVAIVPRSFCNGPYFQDFRRKFFDIMSLKQIHVFGSRSKAFKGDEVLQENVILHSIKKKSRAAITVSSSSGADFTRERKTGRLVASDHTSRKVPHSDVLPKMPGDFVFIATNEMDQAVVDRITQFRFSLSDLGIEVSTGPVVDFRLKDDLRDQLETGAVPLLYPTHFQGSKLAWPKEGKKPNAIMISEQSGRWLWNNESYMVVTKRFSSKEETKRVVASVYDGSLPGDKIGFENHLNVYHSNKKGLSKFEAYGLSAYLNSSLVDRYFRLFNGHTQVNATDLRSLVYPSKQFLEKLGRRAARKKLTQLELDEAIEESVGEKVDSVDPNKAKQRVDEALEILKALGVPRQQQNKRSALTLLALVALRPDGKWEQLEAPLMGITPIMEFCRESYGENYAPNTRETFRRQTMHQFVEAGIAVYNPDKPDRPPNSPKACYQVSEEAFAMMKTFGSKQWNETLAKYLEGQPSLAAKWAKRREMEMVPVALPGGGSIELVPGDHSILIRDIVEKFAPRYAPGSELIYVGDTGSKMGHFEEERLAQLGVTVNKHGKMPDVVLYFGKKDWLLLIESVTSHGPVDSKRHQELSKLFSDAKPGLVYVTAFPSRQIMGRYLSDISWETEVWCADAPTHLIHFNGERFLGPYE